MKRVLLALVCAALVGTSAFAQKFSLGAHASAGQWLYLPEEMDIGFHVWPAIDLAVELDKVDVLFEIDFGITKMSELQSTTITLPIIGSFPVQWVEDYTFWILGFKGGVAPKLKASDKVTFSFPIWLKFIHIGYKADIPSLFNIGEAKNGGRNVFGIDLGARAYYAATEKVAGFIGFQVPLFAAASQMKGDLYGGGTFKNKDSQFHMLNSGAIDLGVKFTF